VTKIGELGTTQAANSNRRTLRRNIGISSSETSVLTRATRRNNPEDTILHSHRRENLKSYISVQDLTPCSPVMLVPAFLWQLPPASSRVQMSPMGQMEDPRGTKEEGPEQLTTTTMRQRGYLQTAFLPPAVYWQSQLLSPPHDA
jgi:hypothetical protein